MAEKARCRACVSRLVSGPMRTDLRRDLTVALKARDRVAVTALRSALAAIDNAEAVADDRLGRGIAGHGHVAGSAVGVGAAEVERRELTEADLRAIVSEEVQDRSVAAEGYEQAGRHDRAERLRAEADVLRGYVG